MAFVTSSDVVLLHSTLAEELALLIAAASRGVSEGKINVNDPQAQADYAAFQAFQQRIGNYLADEPSDLRAGSQMDTGQALQRELATWHAKLAAYGVALGPAPAPAPKETTIPETISSLAELVKWGAILYFGSKLLNEFGGKSRGRRR